MSRCPVFHLAQRSYCRWFPAARDSEKVLSSEEENRLAQLGEAMRYTVEREGTLTPRIGYTYFGQFVGHDLTEDQTCLAGPYQPPEQTVNCRTPYLDLGQVYGGGPKQAPHLYEGDEGAELLKIGRTETGVYRRDLPIEQGQLLIADTRNLDNLILRQLHVLFLKFHNEAVRQLSGAPPTLLQGEVAGTRGTIFERAQRLVQWHYQWIVRHDFLPRILHSGFWNWQRRSTAASLYFTDHFTIPIEFAIAGYRFGHSMVRNAYGLNCQRPRVTLEKLMRAGSDPSPLSDDYLIEWGRFFDGLSRSGPPASSSFIDTSLARPLHELSPSIIRLSNKRDNSNEPARLPTRTLIRGARTGLATGQEVARITLAQGLVEKDECLTSDQLERDLWNRTGSALVGLRLNRETPLFYYLLKEAEIHAAGLCLGPVGSHLVGDVILGALGRDPSGYISNVGPHWRLPLWQFPNGLHEQVHSLVQLIRLVGDDSLLPQCRSKWHALTQMM